jgi:V/A-type H+-transporting ATPase subunit A
MEELPGPDAFPMDLGALISNFYGRAGYVYLKNGEVGSVTFLGTVSPAGCNLKEPVTENTKKVARCFYALEQARADSKRYPAVNPLDSYSKYLEYPEIREFLDRTVEHGWVEKVNALKVLVRRGKEANDQINILGDDGVPMSYHEAFWKSELIDFSLLQQDGFDPVDSLCPMERQKYMVDLVRDICAKEYKFDDYEKCREWFKELINLLRQMNYSKFESEPFMKYREEITKHLETNGN